MKHSKSSLFLMEFIVALFFFTLACAICVQLYTKCFQISHLSVDQNHACLWASNLAELWYDALDENEEDYNTYLLDTFSRSENIAESALVYPGYIEAGDPVLCLYFDADWKLLKDPSVFSYPDARYHPHQGKQYTFPAPDPRPGFSHPKRRRFREAPQSGS